MFSDLKKTGNQITFSKQYDVLSVDEFETVKLKRNVKQNNGSIVAPCILVDYQNIYSGGRRMQTRVRDTADDNIVRLTSQIKKDGLLHIPTVKWDAAEKQFDLLGGHHRLSVLWDIHDETEEDPDKPCLVPVCVLEFPTDEDQHNFLLADNDHPKSLGHSREDAKKMLQDKEESGAFKNLNENQKQQKAEKYLRDLFSNLAPTPRTAKNLYQALLKAPVAVSFIKPKVSEIKEAQQKAWGHTTNAKHAATLQDDGSVAVHGNTQMYQNSVGNFRKNFWRQYSSCPEQKFGIKVATHVQIQTKTSPDNVKKQRQAMLKDLANENKLMYLPSGRGHVKEVLFMAQIKDGIDANSVYVWDDNAQDFVFKRNV